MSVEDVDKIDSIGIPKDSPTTVSLAISDHLPWEFPIEEHLYKLQEKINSYIVFIESGQIYETFPASQRPTLKVIEIFFKYALPKQAVSFLEQVSDILHSMNIELKYSILE